MVPLGTLADIRAVNGPLILTRYNTYPASAVNGHPGPGVSSRQAIDMMRAAGQSRTSRRPCAANGPSWPTWSFRRATRR